MKPSRSRGRRFRVRVVRSISRFAARTVREIPCARAMLTKSAYCVTVRPADERKSSYSAETARDVLRNCKHAHGPSAGLRHGSLGNVFTAVIFGRANANTWVYIHAYLTTSSVAHRGARQATGSLWSSVCFKKGAGRAAERVSDA